MKNHPKYKDAEKFLRELIPGNGPRSSFICYNRKFLVAQSELYAGCHYYFKLLDDLSLVASTFCLSKDSSPAAKLFAEWINGDNHPYRIITQNKDHFEIIEDEDHYKGFIVGPEILDCVSIAVIKSFCIFMRGPQEYPSRFKTWHYLVDEKKLDPRDAYYLCKIISDTSQDSKFIFSGEHDGAHWPLNYPNYKKYYYGNICVNKTNNTLSGFFNSKGDLVFGKTDLESEVIKGQFGEYKVYDIDVIIEGFLKWKELSVDNKKEG